MSHKFPKVDHGLAMDMLSTFVACLYDSWTPQNISIAFTVFIFQIYTGHFMDIHWTFIDFHWTSPENPLNIYGRLIDLQWTSYGFTVDVVWIFTGCLVSLQQMSCGHPVNISCISHWTFCLGIHWTFHGLSMDVWWTSIKHFMDFQWMFRKFSLDILWIFTEQLMDFHRTFIENIHMIYIGCTDVCSVDMQWISAGVN